MVGSMKRIAIASLVVVALLLAAGSFATLNAQVVGATLTGTITDASGGAIAGAQISCKNVATDVTREIVSDSAGFYTLPNLGAGTYTVTVTAAGFTTQIRSDFTLTVGESHELDVTMSVGQVAQKVEISGSEAPAVETTSSEISAVVNPQTIVDLPLNGRSWTDLTELQRGVSVITTTSSDVEAGQGAGGSCNRGCGVQYSINGGRPQQNSYRIDGVSINDQFNAGPGSQANGGNLGVDAIQEYSVITDNQSAEYGREAGGVINAVTSAGTNEFHGTAFEFLRNSALDSRTFFDPAGEIPPFRRNQFGGSLGGPIQKGKTFFFVSYEGLRQFLNTSTPVIVPSPNAREGILATGNGCTTAGGCTVAVAAPIVTALNLYPTCSNIVAGSPNESSCTLILPDVTSENFLDARVDRTFSTKDSIAGTFQWDKAKAAFADGFDNQTLGNLTQRLLVSIAETHVFSSTLVNTAHVGFTRFTAPIGQSLGAINPADKDTSISTVGAPVGMSVLTISGGFNSNPGGFDAQASSFNFFNTYQFYDDVFLTKGKNSFKFGFAFEHDQQIYDNSTQTGGTWAFSSLLKFLEDEPTSLSSQIPGTLQPRRIHQSIVGTYIQDDYRIKSNLTLNLGLRYEMSTVPHEQSGEVSNLAFLYQPTPTLGNPYWRNPTYRNFEPRVGFAWDPFKDGKSSVRGGFGMFDILPLYYEITSQGAQAQPFFEVGAATFDGNTPGLFPTNGFSQLVGVTSTFRGTQFQDQPKRNYVEEWNLDLQRQLTPSISISAGYVGTRGVHMVTKTTEDDIVEPMLTSAGWLWPGPFGTPGVDTKNQRINTNFGDIKATYWLGDSDYNGLVMQIQKRMSHGFYIQGAFTWSKSLDDTSSVAEGNGFTNSIGGPDLFDLNHSAFPTLIKNLDYGPSDFNVGRTLWINGVWNIPGPHSDNTFVKLAARGWQVSGIFRASDGAPFTPTWGTSGNVTGSFGSTNNGFVDRIPDCKTINPQNTVHYVNVDCFTLPQAPDQAFWNANCDPLLAGSTPEVFPTCVNLRGTARRNSLVGPGMLNLDFSAFKNTYVTEKLNVQFRVEAYNIANRSNFLPPSSTDLFSSTGAVVGTYGRITSESTTAREIQFGVKLIF
jgi:Carboxypeptidase regulatory-like domain/TonB-dependent Receptor Plug Domain